MKNVSVINYYFLIITGLLLTLPAFAEQESGSIFDHLILQKEGFKVELETDMDSVLASRKEEEEIPGVFSYKDADGNQRTWKVDLTTRGKFRRRVCPFPPLLVQFKKKELAEAGFNDHNDLKLVTHCVDNSTGDEYVLREYLVYKMYQILTDVHFRVQLIRIKYKDSDSGTSITRYGILLEDEDEMKARHDSKFCKDCFGFPTDSLMLSNVYTHDLFQYMIGNPDWNYNMLRNIRLLIPQSGRECMIVPYDFDFSGVVNAAYAVPDPTLGITQVRQRRFMGLAASAEELQPTIAHFKAKQSELEKLIRQFKPLSAFARKDVLAFVQSFYDCLDEFDPELVSLCGTGVND